MRLWGVIALDAVLTHNLLVMVHASDAETRKLAASEVSRTVLAGIAASVGLVGA